MVLYRWKCWWILCASHAESLRTTRSRRTWGFACYRQTRLMWVMDVLSSYCHCQCHFEETENSTACLSCSIPSLLGDVGCWLSLLCLMRPYEATRLAVGGRWLLLNVHVLIKCLDLTAMVMDEASWKSCRGHPRGWRNDERLHGCSVQHMPQLRCSARNCDGMSSNSRRGRKVQAKADEVIICTPLLHVSHWFRAIELF